MEKLTVIRKRLIPLEEVDISGDEQLYFDGKVLVTRWVPIKPRRDIGWGISHTCPGEGYKVSAFYDRGGHFKYWYWDIIDADFYPEEHKLVVRDLLVDVVVDMQFHVQILDRDEVRQALSLGLITDREGIYIETVTAQILKKISLRSFPLAEAAEGKYTPPKGFVPYDDGKNDDEGVVI